MQTLWEQMNTLATSTYEAQVGFAFASTTEWTEQIMVSGIVFPFGFLDTNSDVLIAYFVIIVTIMFAYNATLTLKT